METFRDQDLEYLAKRYDSIKYLSKRYDRITEKLAEVLKLLNRPDRYSRDRVILEVEDFLKKFG